MLSVGGESGYRVTLTRQESPFLYQHAKTTVILSITCLTTALILLERTSVE